MKLVITDLDNTLYDWVTYFSLSFRAMAERLSALLNTPLDKLLGEFKAVHQKHHNSEHPFALLEIATVRERFGDLPPSQLKSVLDDALHEFNRQRRATLHLYPGVMDTLNALRAQEVVLVAHTEAVVANAYFRMRLLGIAELFKHLYAIEGSVTPHPIPDRGQALAPPPGLLRVVPRSERKPNPRLLLDICARENVDPKDAIYVGDSLTRDMSMAKAAGVRAVWAKYGTEYDRELWDLLVRITHWSDEDVQREEDLRKRFSEVTPDVTIESFSELLAGC